MERKIKIFRNWFNDSTLENDVNYFLKKKNDKILNINYLATSNNGSISIIVEYLEK